MATPGFNTLHYYATPPNNYIGTIIFLSYILLALSTTISIVSSLYTQYTALVTHASAQDKHIRTAVRRIKLFVLLASVSFAMLSYHMLFFLITHYYTSFDTVSANGLKEWMIDSNLFRDFAQDLVSTRWNAVVTHVAILETWFWGVWMAWKGLYFPFHLIAPQLLVAGERELTSSSAAIQPVDFDDGEVHPFKSNPTNKFHNLTIHYTTAHILPLLVIPSFLLYPTPSHNVPLPPHLPPQHHSPAPPLPLGAAPPPLHRPRLTLARYPAISAFGPR
jgi:hypothetical protein